MEDVKDNVNRRIERVEEETNVEDYILIIPFTVRRSKGKPNEDCITKPIEWLRDRGFRVLVVYLKKMRWIDLFMKKIMSNEIESTEDYDKQAEDLEKLIKAI